MISWVRKSSRLWKLISHKKFLLQNIIFSYISTNTLQLVSSDFIDYVFLPMKMYWIFYIRVF